MSVRAEPSPTVTPGESRRVLARIVFALVLTATVAGVVLEVLARQEGLPRDFDGGNLVFDVIFLAAIVAFPVVGVLITNRHPGSRIGWICLLIGVSWGLVVFLEAYALYGLKADPGSLPIAEMAVVINDVAWAPGIVLMGVYLLLLFPDGQPPGPRWRYVLWAAGIVTTVLVFAGIFSPTDYTYAGYPDVENPIAIDALKPFEGALIALVVAIPISIVASAVGLVVRYRRTHGTERLQLKWLVTAGVVVALLYGVSFFLSAGEDPDETFTVLEILWQLAVSSFGLIPAAIGIAVLKHRLYDIDVVIKKTLVYGVVAAFITVVYVGIVVGIGRAIGTTRNLGLSIVATAIVAVAFQPVRERVQTFANRLVYGQRATPYEVLSEFSGGMAQILATEELLPRMARIVAEGTGAARSDIWLLVGSDLIPEASWPEDAAPPSSLPNLRGADIVVDGPVTAIPVRHQGELLGAIAVTKNEPLNPVEAKLLEDLASQAGLVLRNVRLIEDLKVSRQRLVNAQDEERRRLERDLHDGAQQRLVAIALALKMARGQVKGDPNLAQRIDQAGEELSLALAELREFARGIHPAILTERGLGPALQSLAERSSVPATLDSTLDGRLPLPIETTAYFAVSEALANVAKYARASHVSVAASHQNGTLEVTVIDDGIGGADPSRGSGLRGLFDRVAVVDGTLEVDSPPGEGTRLHVRIPVPDLVSSGGA